MAEAIVSIVVGRLTDLLTEDAHVLHGVHDEIQELVTEFMRMKTFLPDADSRIHDEQIGSLLANVRDLAYDAEHVVETFFVKASLNERKRRKQENKYRIKIKDVQRKLCKIYDRFAHHNIRSTLESPESSDSTHGPPGMLKRFQTFNTVEPKIFVEPTQGDVDRLVEHLVDESDSCYPLISICGMGGLGKTTLAEKLYNHPAIKKYFAGLAWVSISQKWQTKQVLQRLLICLDHERKEEILKMDDDKLAENLQQIQQKKKCLIVLDDIWSNNAWDSIKAAFTAEKSLSKLLLTSRNVKVAEYVNPKGLIHQPECLSADQSWELLRLKALSMNEDDCLAITRDVSMMEKLGREMVANCGGLPLAIVILGGILVTKPSLIEWEKVYNDSLSSPKRGKGFGERYEREYYHVLVWSYDDLPPQLKPCFLYLSKFGEDERIDTETLYQLWIAEGIVLSSDKREGETMMQVAESYLGELVHRSMVQVRFNDFESSVTKFKSCSLHDLMRDLSLSLAKAEDFFEAIDLREGNDFHVIPSGDSSANTRQLVVDYPLVAYFISKPNHRQYRSILIVNVDRWSSWTRRLGSYLANFKLLRVLDLGNLEFSRQSVLGALFGTNIGRVLGNLVYLRYLSLRGSNMETFPWIQKLVLLQTLNLNGGGFDFGNFFVDTKVGSIYKPSVSSNVLSKFAHLRHLYLTDLYLPDLYLSNSRKNFKLRFNGLSKLETLENFDTRWCEVKDLPKLSSLRRLKLKAEGNYDEVKEMFKYLSDVALSSNSCLGYLALDFVISDRGLVNNPDMIKELLWNHKFILHELSIIGKLPELSVLFEQQQQLNHTHIDVSLIRITTLKLSYSDLEEDPMPVLEKIPTLRDLTLRWNSYVGKEMVCSAMGFPRLTRLNMWNLPNLEKWRVEEGSMPILQHLKITKCQKLEELPEGLIFLNSLRKLYLTGMPSEFCDRLRSENGEQGPHFYKVAHIPDLNIYNPTEQLQDSLIARICEVFHGYKSWCCCRLSN